MPNTYRYLTKLTSNHCAQVRLRNIGGHVNLEVRVTPVRFAEGTLVPDRSTWIGNDNTPATSETR